MARQHRRRGGGVATQRPAKPCTPVRFRSAPSSRSPGVRPARKGPEERMATRRSSPVLSPPRAEPPSPCWSAIASDRRGFGMPASRSDLHEPHGDPVFCPPGWRTPKRSRDEDKPIRVLIVDDDPAIRELLRLYLERSGRCLVVG